MKLFNKKLKTFIIMMKSGNVILLQATNCKIEYNTETGALESYAFSGVTSRYPSPLFLHFGEVEAILEPK